MDCNVSKHLERKEEQVTATAPFAESTEESRSIKSVRAKRCPQSEPAPQEKGHEMQVEKIELMGNISPKKSTKPSRVPRKELQVDVTTTSAERATFPTPPPSKDSPPGAKRTIADIDGPADRAEQSYKKHFVRSSSPLHKQITVVPLNEILPDQVHPKPEFCEHLQATSKLAPVGRKSKKVTPKFPPAKRFAPVISFPRVNFVDYGDSSIPILYSIKINHVDRELLSWPNVYQRVEAFALLEHARGFITNDLGRTKVTDEAKDCKDAQETNNAEEVAVEKAKKVMKEPTEWIDECDLYLHNSKIHVATEAGLLLVVDYLRLAGIPDTTPVRFRGVIPGWAKAAKEARYVRRFKQPSLTMQMNYLSYHTGHYVMVYDHNPLNGMAYGRRMDNNTLGWFFYGHTDLMDTEVEVHEWEIPILYPEPKPIRSTAHTTRLSIPPALNEAPATTTEEFAQCVAMDSQAVIPSSTVKPTPGSSPRFSAKGAADDSTPKAIVESNEEAEVDGKSSELIETASSGEDTAADMKKPVSPVQASKYDRSVEDEVDWEDD
jgi:hypothetical protein